MARNSLIYYVQLTIFKIILKRKNTNCIMQMKSFKFLLWISSILIILSESRRLWSSPKFVLSPSEDKFISPYDDIYKLLSHWSSNEETRIKSHHFNLPTDIYETKENFTIYIDVPGLVLNSFIN